MQERPFDYPGSQSEEYYEVFQQLGQFRVDAEDGESYTIYTTLLFSRLADEAEITEIIRDRFASYHCQHSYDCCGHFYPGNALWSFASRIDKYNEHEEYNQTVIVKQTFRCNV